MSECGRLLVLSATLPITLGRTPDGDWTCSSTLSFATYIQRVVEEEELLTNIEMSVSPSPRIPRTAAASGQSQGQSNLPISMIKPASSCKRTVVRHKKGSSMH